MSEQATILKQVDHWGVGCFLQCFGLLLFVGGFFAATESITVAVVLIPLGIWLMLYGERRSKWLECSRCGMKLANKWVQVCPACQAELDAPT